MGDPFTKYRNADGKTYDGASMLSDLSGLSREEVRWTFDRLKHLMQVERKPRAEAQAIVAEEAKKQPWKAA